LDTDLKSSLSAFNISYNAESLNTFQKQTQVKFVDALISHIQNRLPDTGKLASFSIFNPKDLPESSEKACKEQYGEDKVTHLGELYGNGEPPLIFKVGLSHEWTNLRVYMILHCKNKSMKEMLKLLANQGSSLHLVYPNFAVLSRICLALPISTADCERAFSTMRRIKSRLRSQMNNDSK